ncbi:hypothetical protein V6N11_043917 [Hibiscus sabdariffa]|uniref:Uncharacterized protein n=1 Tax=Hibiscus sabdariffa TaxID=183260 RepID=A0ABR2RDZ2_9ROSI
MFASEFSIVVSVRLLLFQFLSPGRSKTVICDLPVDLIKEENQLVLEEDGEPVQTSKTAEDFNFGSWGGSLSIKREMCAADEVFFKG